MMQRHIEKKGLQITIIGHILSMSKRAWASISSIRIRVEAKHCKFIYNFGLLLRFLHFHDWCDWFRCPLRCALVPIITPRAFAASTTTFCPPTATATPSRLFTSVMPSIAMLFPMLTTMLSPIITSTVTFLQALLKRGWRCIRIACLTSPENRRFRTSAFLNRLCALRQHQPRTFCWGAAGIRVVISAKSATKFAPIDIIRRAIFSSIIIITITSLPSVSSASLAPSTVVASSATATTLRYIESDYPTSDLEPSIHFQQGSKIIHGQQLNISKSLLATGLTILHNSHTFHSSMLSYDLRDILLLYNRRQVSNESREWWFLW
mmetsp:Transcript_11950/g.17971  ORF Transcript_11950/g.17971 Transcript_11950/m.17971 type:complete len:321 (+) Transcript_11950:76-1038(+)